MSAITGTAKDTENPHLGRPCRMRKTKTALKLPGINTGLSGKTKLIILLVLGVLGW